MEDEKLETQEKQKLEKNLKLYYWYSIFAEPLFWGPILIIAIMKLGNMSLPHIYFMEAVVILGLIFLEIPTGALADRIGRKRTMVLGGIFLILESIWFAAMNSPFDVWGANLTWVVGFVLCSGANSALLYDSLKALRREHEFKKFNGRALGAKLLVTAFTSLVAGFLAEIDLRLPMMLCVPGMFVSLGIVLKMYEPPITKKVKERGFVDIMKVSVLFVANNKSLKWIVLFSALLATASKVWFFTYNPYFELVELPVKYFGVLFFALNIIAWIFSKYAHEIEKYIGEFRSILLMLFCVTVPVILMGTFVTVLAVPLVLIQNVKRGLFTPFVSDFIHKRIDSDVRATVDSIKSSVKGLSEFLGLALFGTLLTYVSLPTALIVLGVVVAFFGLYAIDVYRRL